MVALGVFHPGEPVDGDLLPVGTAGGVDVARPAVDPGLLAETAGLLGDITVGGGVCASAVIATKKLMKGNDVN